MGRCEDFSFLNMASISERVIEVAGSSAMLVNHLVVDRLSALAGVACYTGSKLQAQWSVEWLALKLANSLRSYCGVCYGVTRVGRSFSTNAQLSLGRLGLKKLHRGGDVTSQ